MVKSKSSVLAKIPKEQRSQFLIGPVSSWFMPNSSDLWTQTTDSTNDKPGDIDTDMVLDITSPHTANNETKLSYFCYGSIGCFCYGEIHNHDTDPAGSRLQQQADKRAQMSAIVNRLIDIKEDNSRVSCVRFLKNTHHPFVMILTESGTLLIHNCLTSDNIIQFKKSELVAKLVEPFHKSEDMSASEHCNKKPRFNFTQQINSCAWPNARNAFLGISLLKIKTNLLIWLKLKDISSGIATNKSEFIESFEKLAIDMPQYASPICAMEASNLNPETCLIAVATDDGLITVVSVNINEGQSNRIIKLARHNDQVCSMSFHLGQQQKFRKGLLASVSRDGLVLVWDIEHEFYFADFQASSDNCGRGNSKINWFALTFVSPKEAQHTHLAVSNPESGLTLLELPDNVRSKTRLKDNREKPKRRQGEQSIRHHALLFNVVCDPQLDTLMTTSLDGTLILWSCYKHAKLTYQRQDKKEASLIELQPQYLFPMMSNDSRTHMLRFSPIREDLLCAALGKAGVRFHKVSNNPMNHRFEMSPSCALIARKMTKASLSPTSLAWHPSHEYRLAIGTLEGKVLRVELTPHKAMLIEADDGGASSTQKTSEGGDLFDVEYEPVSHLDAEDTRSVISNQQRKTDGVYSLCWGPNPACPEDTSRLAIYAIGSISHRLFIYYNRKESSDKLMNYLDEFNDQSLPEALDRSSEVAWKSSLDYMALGTVDGAIVIVSYLEESHVGRSENRLFRKLAVIQGPLGSSYIQCLVWHPTTDSDDARYYYIAASANESAAYVFNIKESLLVEDVKTKLKIATQYSLQHHSQGDGDDVTTSSRQSNYVHKLEAHTKAISDIVWNPHDPDQLATASFDRTCYVWSLTSSDGQHALLSDNAPQDSARIVSKFSARDRLFTLEWSLVDPDLILTSGHDCVIWAWRPSENPFTTTTTTVSSS